jgi:hypothetical protein
VVVGTGGQYINPTLGYGLDGIINGSTYGRPLLARLNAGRPWIDFSENIHSNKNLGNIADGTARFAVANGAGLGGVSYWDTNNNPRIDFTQNYHVGKNLGNIADGTARFAVANGAGLGGVSYWDSNNNPRIDFTGAYHIGKSLANVPDATGRYAVTNMGSGNAVSYVDGNNRALIDFSQSGHLNKTIDYVPDGTSRFAVTNAANLYGVSSVDPNNRAGIDFSQSVHLNKNLDNIGDGTTYQRAQQYSFGNNTGTDGVWMHVGTLVLSYGSSATLTWHTGNGYNNGGNQQTICTITIRSANGTAAPNLSGISVFTYGNTQPIEAFAAQATGGSTSASNTSWELYAQLRVYTTGPLECVINRAAGDSFSFSGAVGSDPGSASSTVVIGNIGLYLNPVAGSGLDGVFDGTTYQRMPAANMDGNRRGLIDFSQSGHLYKNLGNIADGTSRFAVTNAANLLGVSSVDPNNRALIDFSQSGHLNKTIDNVPDGTTRFAVVNGPDLKGVSLIDASNRALIDFSQAGHLNKNQDYVVSGSTYGQIKLTSLTSGSVDLSLNGVLNRNLQYIADAGGRNAVQSGRLPNGAAGWYNLGTWAFTTVPDSFRLELLSGSGYNTNGQEQSYVQIFMRTANYGGGGTTAPNVSGVTWQSHGQTSLLTDVKLVASGSNTTGMGNTWDVYANLGGDVGGELTWHTNSVSTFTANMAAASDPGGASATVVIGQGSPVTDVTGRITTINGAVSPLGSIVTGSVSSGFNYTGTSSSVTISWTAGTIYRMDGSTTAVGAGSVTVTGLNASATYYAAAYYDEVAGSVEFVTGQSGAVGSPAILYPAEDAVVGWQAQLQARLNLGWVPVATGASGGGGTGGNGSTGCCLHGEQLIELANGVMREAQELTTGDVLTSPAGKTQIVQLRIEPWREWYTVEFNDGRTLKVAPDHRFMDPSGVQIHARDLKLQDVVEGRGCYLSVARLELSTDAALKVNIEVQAPHTYYVDGVLSHNKMLC